GIRDCHVTGVQACALPILFSRAQWFAMSSAAPPAPAARPAVTGSTSARRVLTGRHFMLGDHACAEGALAAGLDFFAGYPITPSKIGRAACREGVGIPGRVG